jgi:hypothetical protein
LLRQIEQQKEAGLGTPTKGSSSSSSSNSNGTATPPWHAVAPLDRTKALAALSEAQQVQQRLCRYIEEQALRVFNISARELAAGGIVRLRESAAQSKGVFPSVHGFGKRIHHIESMLPLVSATAMSEAHHNFYGMPAILSQIMLRFLVTFDGGWLQPHHTGTCSSCYYNTQ